MGIVIGGLTYLGLYQSSVRQWRTQLTYLVQSHARLIEAVARFDEQYSGKDVEGGAFDATLMQLRDGYQHFSSFGKTGDFTVGRIENGDMVFLICQCAEERKGREVRLPMRGNALAEPMRQALLGRAGTMIGLDCEGKRVLAAYEPVAVLNVGIVAQIAMAELIAPVAWRSLLAGATAMLLTLLGYAVFRRMAAPVMRQLAEQEAKYRALFEGSSQGVVVLKEVIEECNGQVGRMFGAVREEIIGRSPLDFSPPIQPDGRESAAALREYLDEALAGSAQSFTWQARHRDGQPVDIEVHLKAIEIQGQRLLLATISDQTERLSLERQLQQAQKMEAVGKLAGGVAHDFNNLMTVIMGYAEMLSAALEPDSPRQEEIQEVLRASGRAVDLTRQLLIFARRQIVSPRVVNLNQLIQNVDRMLRRLLGEDIEIVTALEPELKHVKVDPGQFEQLLMNLAINARDAMPAGGRLTIETANVTLDEAYARTHAGVTPGDCVMLAISDTGHGMTPEVMARIFEPFFTTKEAGRGTGLGLATAYGMVTQAGGHIRAYSEVGRGTTFKVYLPVTAAAVEQAGEPARAAELPRGSETILLAEDEPQLRRLAAEILAGLGYRVLEAANGAEALALARKQAWRVDLLLTDVIMPQMNGQQLAEHFRKEAPGTRILFMSGYTENMITHQGVLEAGVEFVAKPFTAAGLALKVRQVLDGGKGD